MGEERRRHYKIAVFYRKAIGSGPFGMKFGEILPPGLNKRRGRW
jgi:hypothetical protein